MVKENLWVSRFGKKMSGKKIVRAYFSVARKFLSVRVKRPLTERLWRQKNGMTVYAVAESRHKEVGTVVIDSMV